MIKFSKILLTVVLFTATSSCIKETRPQNSQPTLDQVLVAPEVYQGFVEGLTTSLAGKFAFGVADSFPFDFGYPAFFLQRDLMGQDITLDAANWFSYWYCATTALNSSSLICQHPWRSYYQWINNCNTVLSLAGDDPSEDLVAGAGIALAMRAMFYMDLARMYVDADMNLTIPIRTEKTTLEELTTVGNATWDEIWEFIFSDLEKAEVYLAHYERSNVYTPDVSVVYGLKARAYLELKDWANAEKYAKLAQEGYTAMTKAQYTDRMTAFNTPNEAWMMGLRYNATSENILENDSDSNWGSHMFLEVKGGLYASAYGYPKRIDAHLFSTIPATDFRKDCYIDPALDNMDAGERTAVLIERYSDYPQYIDQCAEASYAKVYAHLPLKFRAAGGEAGRENPYLATATSVPMMRVEEMKLIEAEAAGMQNETRGKDILATFAQSRDASWTYNSSISFQDNVWWQRRVELWGEGFATFDIKRLKKGIIRSYEGTNHLANYRWNTEGVPNWMNLCIVESESDPNPNIISNPAPSAPSGDSTPHVW